MKGVIVLWWAVVVLLGCWLIWSLSCWVDRQRGRKRDVTSSGDG